MILTPKSSQRLHVLGMSFKKTRKMFACVIDKKRNNRMARQNINQHLDIHCTDMQADT